MVVDPSSSNYYYWSAIVMIACLYNLVMVIVRAVFDQPHEGWMIALWFPLDYIADFIYLLDMFAKSRIGKYLFFTCLFVLKHGCFFIGGILSPISARNVLDAFIAQGHYVT